MSRHAAKARERVAEAQPLPPLDTAAVGRARKVWLLAIHGQSEGERSAGQGRMVELAARYGMTMDAFMAACGITKPRIRVKAPGRPLAL